MNESTPSVGGEQPLAIQMKSTFAKYEFNQPFEDKPKTPSKKLSQIEE